MLFTGVLTLALVASATAFSTGIQDTPQNLMTMAMSHCKRGFVPLHGTNCPVTNPPSSCPLKESWGNAFMPQSSQSPYRLEFKPPTLTSYTPGTPLTVELVGPVSSKFKGFFVYADVQNVFLQANNQFQASGLAKPSSYCSTKGVTHVNSSLKDRISFTFTPDVRIDQGKLQFAATVVKDFRTFYLDVRSKPLSIHNPTNKPTPGKFMQSQFNQGGLADMMKKMMQNFGAGGPGGAGGARPGFRLPQLPQQQPMGGFNMQGMFSQG